MWKGSTSAGNKKTCCEWLNSVPNRCKLFSLLLIIVIQGVIILSYKYECHSTLCLQEHSPIFQSMSQISSHNDDKKSQSYDRPSSDAVTSEVQLTDLKMDSFVDGEDDATPPSEKNAGLVEYKNNSSYDFNAPMTKHLPHFIVIGTKKSGSRAILNYIGIHPDIVVSRKEVHFFDRPENYAKGMDWYLQQMPPSKPHMLTGEKSPAYYRTEEAPGRIHAMNSSIKLLCIVKEPITRVMSNYLHNKVHNVSDESDFPTFEESILNDDGAIDPNSYHIYNSDYNLFVGRWLKDFPREQLLFVDGSLMIKDPAKVMKRVQSFLGVRQYMNESFFKFDKKKGFFCYKKEVKGDFMCFGESKGREHPPIHPDTRLLLSNYFKPRNAKFFHNIGEAFDWDT